MTEPDADAALIDRLYADGGAAAADEDAALAGMRTVRGLVARVRDEMPGVEPPQAISARLLQAAAGTRPAPVVAAQPSWWARFRGWFGNLAMHPGLAAAATLVVVAGAVAIWMRQGGKAATPTVSSTGAGADKAAGAALDESPAERRTLGLDDDRPAPEARAEVTGTQATPVKVSDTEQTVRSPDKARPREVPPADDPAPPREPARHTAGGAGSGSASGSTGSTNAEEGTGTPEVTTTTTTTTTTTEDDLEKDEESRPPPPPRDPGGTTPEPTPSPDTTEGATGGSSKASMARQLTRQAVTAAKKGDCATVDFLAKKVKGLDARYYASDFVPQPDIAACRGVAR